MICKTVNIALKNGKNALLRSPKKEDAAEMLEYLKKTSGETEFVIRYPEECTMTLEAEEKFIENINNSDLGVMIVCETDGKIAGVCSIHFNGRIKTKHKASVAVAILKDYWNLGIGSAMFDEMIKIAEEKNVLQLELQYVEGNDRARHLYEKKGFRLAAVIPDALRLKDGALLNEYHMIKKL